MFEVWRLHRARRKLVATADKKSTAALKENDHDRAFRIAADNYLDCQRIDERVARFLDQSMRQETQELDIALPSLENREMWHFDSDRGAFLSSKGRFYLRELIDKEKGRRFEAKTLWVTKIILPLAGVLVGIIGALTGLVAVLRHTR